MRARRRARRRSPGAARGRCPSRQRRLCRSVWSVPSAEGARALRLLMNLYNFAAVIVAALLADAVRHARLLTVLAENRLGRAQCVVRAALARARFRVASFRIRHLITPR